MPYKGYDPNKGGDSVFESGFTTPTVSMMRRGKAGTLSVEEWKKLHGEEADEGVKTNVKTNVDSIIGNEK